MTLPIDSRDIPEGHGRSFKKGVADGLLDTTDNFCGLPDGHEQSYRRGKLEGEKLRKEIAERVKR